MNRKLLLNLICEVLLISFCSMGKVVGAAFPLLMESAQETELPSPQELPEPEGIQVICNTHVLEVYDSIDYYSSDLWQTILNLTKETLKSHNWSGPIGTRNLVYHLARKYAESKDQNEKDAIALCFWHISGCAPNELAVDFISCIEQDAADSTSDTEQETIASKVGQEVIDFTNKCILVDEE
ncbi:MAG: hypothetical protein LBF34_03760 [Puniceicoccales bacterium]|nr:hypothetical protein [Puniceicoccales bacterium]